MARPKLPPRACSVQACGSPARSLGYCRAHYHRLRRYGDPLGGPRMMDELARLTTRLAAAEAEALEQARLNGMGAERELALLARAERAEAALARAREEALEEAAALCGRWATEAYRKGEARWDNRAAALEDAEARLLAICALRNGETGGGHG